MEQQELIQNTALAKPEPKPGSDMPADQSVVAFESRGGFEMAQRMALVLSKSSIVPAVYQGAQGVSNCVIALDMASRIGCSVLQVMQNLAIVHGKPSFSSQFLIATVNSCGRFDPLRFEWFGTEGRDNWGCRAWTTDRATGEKVLGPRVTIAMSKAEGWFKRNGSKWPNMPELMLMYRAAAFWTRVFAPELSLGMRTLEEESDIGGSASFASVAEVRHAAATTTTDLESSIMAEPEPEQAPLPEPYRGPSLDEQLEASVETLARATGESVESVTSGVEELRSRRMREPGEDDE